jgi:hypothetical protein
MPTAFRALRSDADNLPDAKVCTEVYAVIVAARRDADNHLDAEI